MTMPVPSAPSSRMQGKSIVVTGAGSEGDFLGTGVAAALLLAHHGADVTVVDIDAGRAEHTRALIAAQGAKANVAVADITRRAECRRAIESAVEQFGGVDGLINNAAIAPGRSEVTDPDGTWGPVLALNLTAANLMCSEAIPALEQRGGGSIVNITSIAALRGFATPAYSASKGGLIALTKSLAFAHGRSGIRVNCIAPGHIHTPMGYRDDALTGRRLRQQASMLGTEGTAWDVALAALFLASDESRWITATVLPVDAGATETVALGLFPHMSGAEG